MMGPKEGIALINGTQLIASLGSEALERAETVARQADVVAALTLEVLKGTSRAFDSGESGKNVPGRHDLMMPTYVNIGEKRAYKFVSNSVTINA